MKNLRSISFMLVVVGAINWGLVGLFDFNLVTVLFGKYPELAELVYALVGISGVYMALTEKPK